MAKFLPVIAVVISLVIALWLYIDTYQNGAYHHERILVTITVSSLLAAYGLTSWQEHHLKRAGNIAIGTTLLIIANAIIIVIINVIRPDASIH